MHCLGALLYDLFEPVPIFIVQRRDDTKRDREQKGRHDGKCVDCDISVFRIESIAFDKLAEGRCFISSGKVSEKGDESQTGRDVPSELQSPRRLTLLRPKTICVLQ